MAIKKVLKMGDPLLHQVAAPVTEFDTTELHDLITDMRDTMAALNGAGLAAPQIGVSKRVVIFAIDNNPRYPDMAEVPKTVLINPQIETIGSSTQGMWEGCLSAPGMRGYVERPAKICYRGCDQYGAVMDRTVDGFHAVVVQHECDHLDGVLYPARITDFAKFGFEEELAKQAYYPY